MAAPLLLLAVVGHLGWAVYATFGAFASVYGGGVRSAGRWRLQAAIGVLLTAAVLCGVVVALSLDRRWLAIPVAAGWAAAAAALSDAYRWRPHGPLFLVFAVAACSSIPSSPSDLVAAFVLASGAATFAVGLGAAEIRIFRKAVQRDRSRWQQSLIRFFIRCIAGSFKRGMRSGGHRRRRCRHGGRDRASVLGHGGVRGADGRAYLSSAVRTRGHRVTGTLAGLVLAAGLLAIGMLRTHRPINSLV